VRDRDRMEAVFGSSPPSLEQRISGMALFRPLTCYEPEATIKERIDIRHGSFWPAYQTNARVERVRGTRIAGSWIFGIFGESEWITERISFRHGSFRLPHIVSLEQ
jgi:hypothetical protein